MSDPMTEGAKMGTGIDVKPANEWIGNILLVKYSTLTEALKVAGEAEDAIRDLLASDEQIQSASDEELLDAANNGWAEDIQKQARAFIKARAALAALERIRNNKH